MNRDCQYLCKNSRNIQNCTVVCNQRSQRVEIQNSQSKTPLLESVYVKPHYVRSRPAQQSPNFQKYGDPQFSCFFR